MFTINLKNQKPKAKTNFDRTTFSARALVWLSNASAELQFMLWNKIYEMHANAKYKRMLVNWKKHVEVELFCVEADYNRQPLDIINS